MRKIELRPVEGLKPDPNQPRKHFDEEELLRLGASLKVRQNDPGQILPDGTIIDGERRWRAAKLVGLEKLEVIVTDKPLSPRELTSIRLSTFFHRVDLRPIERCRAVAEFMEQNPELDQAGAAKVFEISAGTMTHLLAFRKCVKEVQKALEDGHITVSDCYTLSKAAPEDQVGLLNFRLSKGAGRTALQEEVGKLRNGRDNPESPPERTTRVKIPLAVATKEVNAHGTVTVASLPGQEVGLVETENLLREALKAVRDAQGRGLGLKAAQAAWRDMATPKATPKAKAGA